MQLERKIGKLVSHGISTSLEGLIFAKTLVNYNLFLFPYWEDRQLQKMRLEREVEQQSVVLIIQTALFMQSILALGKNKY